MASRVIVVGFFVFVVVFVSAKSVEREPLKCPKDEVFYECALERCYKTCAHLQKPPACPLISPDCYYPACLCKRNHLRNSDGVCVPTQECDTYKEGDTAYVDEPDYDE